MGIDKTAPFSSASLRCDLAAYFKTAFVSISCFSGNSGI
ncbi:hypothetical protein M077_0358 [Bacteroides fragilis str. 2-F-2 |nr:hypothetical protein M077_0358 [Bacteroides fragilis str. 2-F-2 \